jgi:osmotically-inducible protein OsmY
MRRFFNGLVLGIILSAAAFFYFGTRYLQQPGAPSHHESARARAAAATNAIVVVAPRHQDLALLELRDEEIKTELKQNREIIRRKPRDIGDAAAVPDSDSNAVTEIKAQIQADPGLSAWDISVSCAHGHVALIGTVESFHNIGEAIAIALEPGGVRDVTSTLQLHTNADVTQSTNQ